MKWWILAIANSQFLICLGQSARQSLTGDALLSASNFTAYNEPHKPLTAAPKGLKPFYISHYGRHGSRYLANRIEYDYPYEVLLRADEADKLTPDGKAVLSRLIRIRREADGRMGELTPLGALQHRQIARRMFERFPEVFRGDAPIDARSTTVVRCILSMENALQELIRLNPRLQVFHDASHHDMYYMNQTDMKLWRSKTPPAAVEAYEAFCAQHDCSDMLAARLFNDTTYIRQEVDANRLNFYLFRVASNIQNTELRHEMTLYDMFSTEEIYNNWAKENAMFYVGFASCPLTDCKQPFSQRNLLRRIIEEADSCIRLERPGASLRFGHETMVLPLTCLLELNNYGLQTTNLDSLDEAGWHSYEIFPMAANLQFIFYRKNAKDSDVVFKVLLNEEETTLPLPSDQPPYYRWSDFREYFLKKLESYKEDY